MIRSITIVRALRRSAMFGLAAVLGLFLLAFVQSSAIKDDERVIVFQGFASETDASSWKAHVRGWIHEPETGGERSDLSGVLERLIRERFTLGKDQMPTAPEAAAIFQQRAAMFLVDNERNKRLSVTVAGTSAVLGASERNGHFEGDVTLPVAAGRPGEWVEVRADTRPGDSRVFAGKVQLIPRTGFTVVSDIDDTIKHSQVTDKVQLGLNTFFRDFRAAPGMAALYQRLASAGSVVFHYVSGSPFQLYPDLAEFARRDGFPEGSFHLRKFRLKDRSITEFFGDPKAFKLGTIRPILDEFRGRRFILIGDSGERDPEVYAELASAFPHVAAILIRDVTNSPARSSEMAALFSPLPARVERRVFRETRELDDFAPR